VSRLFDVFRKVGPWALDQVFPLYCAGCQNPGQVLCPTCVEGLPRLSPPFCPLCAQPGPAGRCRWCAASPPAVDGIRAPFRMEGAIREAIHGFKYRGLRAAAPQLAQLLADYLEGNPLPGDVLVPVPLHPRRLRRRGYNQAALLARELGKLTGRPVEERLLARTRDTPPQVETGGRAQRAGSMFGAFACAGEARGLAAILLDDVTTTGSTFSACAAALKQGGAASVWSLALAKEA
jgi:ComF family protein